MDSSVSFEPPSVLFVVCVMAGIMPACQWHSTLAVVAIFIQMRLQQEQYALILVRILYGQNETRRKRRYWVRPWLEKRLQFGAYHAWMRQLVAKFPDYFINYMRMELAMFRVFREVLIRLSERIKKQTTSFRKYAAIKCPSECMLAATARAHGRLPRTAFLYRQ